MDKLCNDSLSGLVKLLNTVFTNVVLEPHTSLGWILATQPKNLISPD